MGFVVGQQMSYTKALTIAIAQYIHQKQCHRLSNTTTLSFVVVMDMRRSVHPNSRRPRIVLQACLCAIPKVVQSVSGRFPASARQSGSVVKIPLASYAPFGYLVGACNSARPDEVLTVSSERVQRNKNVSIRRIQRRRGSVQFGYLGSANVGTCWRPSNELCEIKTTGHDIPSSF